MNWAPVSERTPYIPLLFVLLLALWLRLPGITAGLPYFYAEDEAHHFNRTVEMVKEGRYDPQYFHKPSLHFYARMPVVAASYLWSARKGYINSVREIETRNPYGLGGYAFTASHPGIVKWNRAFSVLLSLLTVLLAFLVCVEVTGRPFVALGAALLTAVSPEFLENSPIIGVDVLMSFMCMASAYVALRVLRSYSLLKLAGLGIVCGLAVSSKYNALPIAVLPLCVCLALRKFSLPELATALFAPAAGFFLGSPYILVSIPLFLDHLSYEMWHYGVAGHHGHMEEPGIRQALFYSRWLVTDGVGWFASFAALAGLAFLRSARKREFALFVAFPLLFAALMIGQKTNFTRNMMVMVPFVAVLAGCGLALLLQAFKLPDRSRLLAVWILIPLMSFQPLIGALRYNQSIRSQPESRRAAADWLAQPEQRLGETAVSGKLLFPQFVYRLPGFSRIDATKHSAYQLYQYGFSSLVAGPEHQPSENDRRLLESIRIFDGERDRQRIVKNPAVSVYSIDAEAARSHLLATFERGEFRTVYSFVTHQDQDTDCLDGAGRSARDAGESYCWLKERMVAIKLPVDKNNRVRLEIMSPWKDQELTLSSGSWSHELSFAAVEPGTWMRAEVVLPEELAKSAKGILARVARVQSPAAHGINNDNRRLGIAIRLLPATRGLSD